MLLIADCCVFHYWNQGIHDEQPKFQHIAYLKYDNDHLIVAAALTGVVGYVG